MANNGADVNRVGTLGGSLDEALRLHKLGLEGPQVALVEWLRYGAEHIWGPVVMVWIQNLVCWCGKWNWAMVAE